MDALESREPTVEYSLDREPWRLFRSSLAVEFTPGGRGRWSADDLSDETKAEIIIGLEARSSIISSYARIQSVVRDFARKAGYPARSGGRRGAYIADNNDVFAYAKSVTRDSGTVSEGDKAIDVLFNRIEVTRDVSELIAYGFVSVREEATGSTLFRFQRWRNRQVFTSKDLETLALALTALSREAESRLADAAVQL